MGGQSSKDSRFTEMKSKTGKDKIISIKGLVNDSNSPVDMYIFEYEDLSKTVVKLWISSDSIADKNKKIDSKALNYEANVYKDISEFKNQEYKNNFIEIVRFEQNVRYDDVLKLLETYAIIDRFDDDIKVTPENTLAEEIEINKETKIIAEKKKEVKDMIKFNFNRNLQYMLCQLEGKPSIYDDKDIDTRFLNKRLEQNKCKPIIKFEKIRLNYLETRFFDGKNLDKYFIEKYNLYNNRFKVLNENEKSLIRQELASIVFDIILTIGYMNENNIYHQDLQLDNILVNKYGSFRILDFDKSYDDNLKKDNPIAYAKKYITYPSDSSIINKRVELGEVTGLINSDKYKYRDLVKFICNIRRKNILKDILPMSTEQYTKILFKNEPKNINEINEIIQSDIVASYCVFSEYQFKQDIWNSSEDIIKEYTLYLQRMLGEKEFISIADDIYNKYDKYDKLIM